MTRISQLSKELGMSNADLIDVLKNRMGLVDKKSHSSALSDDQVTEVKKILQSGNSTTSPKAIGKPPVKVTKKMATNKEVQGMLLKKLQEAIPVKTRVK